MTQKGPLNDAARMLRRAGFLLDRVATEDATVTVSADLEAFGRLQHKRLSEAQANIDAALARMAPYQKAIRGAKYAAAHR